MLLPERREDDRLLLPPLERLLPLALARSPDLLLREDEERPLFFAMAPRRPASLRLILPDDEDLEEDEEEELRDAM